MDEHIEEYQPKDHSDLNFVYDEELSDASDEKTASEASPTTAFGRDDAGEDIDKKPLVIVAAVFVACLLLVAGIFLGRTMDREDEQASEDAVETKETVEPLDDA